jgi:hypothetical protein
MMTSVGSAGKAIVFGGVVALAMALAACSSAQSSGSAAAEGTAAGGTAVGGSRPVISVPGMSCAWPTELSAQTDNVAFPDAAEEIFGQPIVASAGTRIVLAGRFPDARYVSVQVYTPDGVGASLTDYRIAPQPGNLNPWQRQGPPGGRFTVTLRSDSAPGQPNTLPLPVGTTSQHTGYLVYRVYLPAGGASAVPVPVLTVDQGGVSRMLPACPSRNAAVTFPAVSGSGSSTAPPPELEFFKPAQSTFNNGGLANVDTSYLLAYLARPPAADVVVVTAKAPAFAPGSHPSPWPAPADDVRYWSMGILARTAKLPTVANKLPRGGTDYGCRADEATMLNPAGDYPT